MHFENKNGMNSNTIDTTATSCISTTSSDSGVVIIDNQTTVNSNNVNNNIVNAPTDKASGKTKRSNVKLINEGRSSTSHINIENILSIEKPADKDAQPENGRRQRPSNGSTFASKDHSPTLSIRSTTISIVSIDENAIDSSVVDSDSDAEADAEGVHSSYTVKKLGQHTTYPPNSPDIPNFNSGLTVISQKINPSGIGAAGGIDNILNGGLGPPALTPSAPQIGSIALSNSTDVTFGDKHFYEGPVTIQQFLIDNGRDKWKTGHGAGQDNPAFRQDQNIKESGCDAACDPTAAEPDQPYKFNFKRKAVVITGTIIILTIVLGIFIVLATNLSKSAIPKSKLPGDGDDSRKNIPINSTIDQDNIGGGNILRIVVRDAWLAQPPSTELVTLDLPVSRVIVLPTNTEMCTTQAACTFRVRFIQTYNIESLQHDDIIYNFLIGGDGNVYEGRGWNNEGAHLKGFNDNSISFAYIGTFKLQNPTDKQMNVTKLLLEEGVQLGKLAPDYKIYSANSLDPTLTATSAGALYASFEDWPHWAEKV